MAGETCTSIASTPISFKSTLPSDGGPSKASTIVSAASVGSARSSDRKSKPRDSDSWMVGRAACTISGNAFSNSTSTSWPACSVVTSLALKDDCSKKAVASASGFPATASVASSTLSACDEACPPSCFSAAKKTARAADVAFLPSSEMSWTTLRICAATSSAWVEILPSCCCIACFRCRYAASARCAQALLLATASSFASPS
mmetsp:Transcript_8422/g.18899  ORF Transcript_8422/g.18899 Transcript_8422/m.18899 type:complete len:202 (-) Transcript_8422:185-790(-)